MEDNVNDLLSNLDDVKEIDVTPRQMTDEDWEIVRKIDEARKKRPDTILFKELTKGFSKEHIDKLDSFRTMLDPWGFDEGDTDHFFLIGDIDFPIDDTPETSFHDFSLKYYSIFYKLFRDEKLANYWDGDSCELIQHINSMVCINFLRYLNERIKKADKNAIDDLIKSIDIIADENFTKSLFLSDKYDLSKIKDNDSGYKVSLLKKVVTIHQNRLSELDQPDLVDFTNNKIPAKIMMLNELGVIDELRSKIKGSENKLSLLISFIIGEEHKSVQPIISALKNEKSDKYLYKRTNPNEPNRAEKKVNALLNDFPELRSKR